MNWDEQATHVPSPSVPSPAVPRKGTFICPLCAQRFTQRSAACQDWNDPRRNFGCPACGTYFLRQQRPRRLVEHLAQMHYLFAAVVAALIFLDRPYMGLHWLLLPTWVALAVWFAFWLDRVLPPRTKLIPLPDDPPATAPH